MQKQLFLLDLDDTLLDTTRLKQDLFLDIANAIGSESPASQKADDIKRLYKIFCQKSKGVVSYRGFADFLKTIFSNQEEQISRCFELDYQQYLVPEAKLLLHELQQQGEVVIWTAGTYEDQAEKLLTTGLIERTEAEKIVMFADFEASGKPSNQLPLAVIDPGKVLSIQERLNWFLRQFKDIPITLIDNEAKNIAAVLEAKNKHLSAIWLDHGEQKKPELAQKLRQELPLGINRFENHAALMSFLKSEGTKPNLERRG